MERGKGEGQASVKVRGRGNEERKEAMGGKGKRKEEGGGEGRREREGMLGNGDEGSYVGPDKTAPSTTYRGVDAQEELQQHGEPLDSVLRLAGAGGEDRGERDTANDPRGH